MPLIKQVVIFVMILFSLNAFFFLQEFCGVVGLSDSSNLESDMTKVSPRTVEILASCHALVFVDNKLVC